MGTPDANVTTHIVNAILAYVVYAKTRCTRDNLVSVLDSTYTELEVSDARDVLWNAVGTDVLGECLVRKESNKRSRRHILCCDIFDAITKLDAADVTFPSFVADPEGIGRLPRYNPEELNTIAMDQRIRALEKQFHILDASTTLKTSRVETLDEDVAIMKVAMEQHANRLRCLDNHQSTLVCTTPASGGQSCTVTANRSIPPPMHKHTTKPQVPSNKDSQQGRDPNHQPSDVSNDQPSGVNNGQPSGVNKQSNSGGILYSRLAGDLDRDPGDIGVDNFIPVRPPRARPKRTGRVVKGKSTSGNTFNGGPSMRHLFLFQVNNKVEVDKVREHMDGKNIKYISVKPMSNPASMFKSFLITVNSEDYNSIMDSDLWPSNTKLREFRMPRGGLKHNNHGTEFS